MDQKRHLILYIIVGAAIILISGLTFNYLFQIKQLNEISTKNSQSERWAPKPRDNIQLQFTDELDTSINVQIYDIDLFDTDKRDIKKLHSDGKKVICYTSVGSWENWRPDSDEFPKSIIGNDYTDWKGEKWLDVRQINVLGPILQKRLALAKEKECDGIDPDNIDGYNNDTGFPITYEDQLKFNIWLAKEARKYGLSIGLKNNVEQALDLLTYYDWALTENCYIQNWCKQMEIFTKADKAVFQIEYNDEKIDFLKACEDAKRSGFSTILKNLELDAWIQICK